MSELLLDDPGVAARFWGKVDDVGDCWVWTGKVAGRGYGQLLVGSRADGSRRHEYAHRMILERELGRPLRDGEQALHSCDNPPCVNPDHLRAGTQRENVHEAIRKGRLDPAAVRAKAAVRRGEDTYNAKLTEVDVRRIRSAKADGACSKVLARRFGVGRRHIDDVVARRCWRHVK